MQKTFLSHQEKVLLLVARVGMESGLVKECNGMGVMPDVWVAVMRW